MEIIILGTNDHAICLAKSCISFSESITFFDYTIQALDAAQIEIDHYYEQDLLENTKIKYGLNIDFKDDGKYIVFDYLPDNEDKIKLISRFFSKITNVDLFFTTSKVYSVSKIASLTSFPNRVIGFQYFRSFEYVKVIELVKGIHSSSKVLEKAKLLMEKVGKEAILVKDTPGFLLNRMTLILINEAIQLLNDGIAVPYEIDKGMELSLGMELGPLKLADNIGLNTILEMLNAIYKRTGNPKYLTCSLLQNMVDAGYVGRESNNGFYSYSAELLNFPHLNLSKQ